MRANLGRGAEEIIGEVYRGVGEFEQGGNHEDDKVVVVMKVA